MRTILLAFAMLVPIAQARDGNVIYAIAYLSYEHRDQVDPALFVKPEGIKFEEPLK